MLNTLGWTIPFASLGAVGIIVAIAAAILVRDAPASSEPVRRGEASISIAFRLKSALTSLYCWQGVFTHWVSMGPVMVFLLLWGTPTLTLGLGISSGEVGTVLTIFAVATVITGPLSGIVSSRLGARRGMIGFVTPMIQAALWIVLFLFADRLSNPLVFVSAIMFAISFSSPWRTSVSIRSAKNSTSASWSPAPAWPTWAPTFARCWPHKSSDFYSTGTPTATPTPGRISRWRGLVWARCGLQSASCCSVEKILLFDAKTRP